MIIDINQKSDSIDISYVTDKNQIAIETIVFDDAEIVAEDGSVYHRQYHNFVECLESDPNVNRTLRSFYGNPIKLEPSKYFSHHNVNYFLNYEIPKFFPKENEYLSRLLLPKPFSVDIETDITDEYGYSNQLKAENAIRSISITNYDLQTLLFIVKNPKHPTITDIDKSHIHGVLANALGDHYINNQTNEPVSFEIKQFDTEIEMLECFLDCTRKYFHMLMGWNIYGYDLQYIFNRCSKLNINVNRASPTGKLTKMRVEINKATHIDLKVPMHRVFIDYMVLFKKSLIYNNLGKYSLDAISELILGLNKVTYSGNLRKLYETDYTRFIAYALVDTLLVMLIHRASNLLGIEFFQSYYTGIPFLKISQNSISEALVYKELISDNIFLLESEKSTLPERKYQGGYVKEPTEKIVNGVMGLDYASLYPNAMITIGCSPESKIDTISVGEDGFPNTPESILKWNEYKKAGYCLSPSGRVYDVSRDALYTRIEKKLLAERKLYRGHADDIYLNILSEIESEMKKRNMN